MSVMVIVLGLGLFAIIVGVAYWFAREEQKTDQENSARGNRRKGTPGTTRGRGQHL
jgi:hypothetical protein